jgi:hypothetical protein
MMESEPTMAVHTLTCPRDNASFKEQDAARLCIHCHEPFLPRTSQVNRCSRCGTEGKNGKLACDCANGRLQVSGYRCPNCRRDGGKEMLAGRIACPYCFHAFDTPAPPVPKSPAAIPAASQSPTPRPSASNPLFPFRRWSEIAALCLVAGVMAAAAYKYGLPLIHRWLEPVKTASPNPQSSDEPPGKQKPSAGRGAEPQAPGPGVVTSQPPDGNEPPAQVKPATIDSFTASTQSIQRGSSTTLSWEVSGDNPTVSLLPGIGAVPPTGSWEVSPQTTQQYTLTAINNGESTPQTRSILIVVVPPPAVTIVSFTAEATHLQYGQATTLRWIVLGASQVRIDPGIGVVGTTGSAAIRPLANTAYILTATGQGGTKTIAVPISVAAPSSASTTYPNYPQPQTPNQIPNSRYGKDLQAIELLSAVQNAMGGKRNLEAIHGWQRSERVTWEFNRGTTLQTTTFIVPSEIRIEAQGSNTTVDFSNGVAGWSWSSTSQVRSSLPPQTATGLPFRELPALLLSDDDPQRTITVAGPSTLAIANEHNDRILLKVDPLSHLPQTITWMNLDGSELEETYSDWRQSAGVMWWGHRMRSRNHQEFFRADVTNLQLK